MNSESHEPRNVLRLKTYPRLPTLGLFLVGWIRLRTRRQWKASESPWILLSEYKNTQNEPIYTPCVRPGPALRQRLAGGFTSLCHTGQSQSSNSELDSGYRRNDSGRMTRVARKSGLPLDAGSSPA